MAVIGMDIGTTSICGVLLDESGSRPLRVEKINHGFLDGRIYTQDPAAIAATVRSLVDRLWQENVTDIGISCQMHGILLLDREGKALSPLYTWKNPFGNYPRGQETYAEYVRGITGGNEISGRGVVTALYLQEQGQIPKDTAWVCTIGDYAALQLTKTALPRMNVTMAESLGCFDIQRGDFCRKTLKNLGLNPDWFPRVSREDQVLGTYRGAGVHSALGDNQCSFLGSTWDFTGSVLLNVGTGQQVSCYAPRYLPASGVEVRSFFDLGYLYVGVSQNGGKSYERFVRLVEDVVRQCTGLEIDGYEALDRLWQRHRRGHGPLQVIPAIYGELEGLKPGTLQIGDIREEQDFGDLLEGYVRGMARELHRLYLAIPEEIRREKTKFYGAGSGIVKNRILRQLTQEAFGIRLLEEESPEAAASGAAGYVRMMKK